MGALDGIRVSDFGQYIAGPLAAVMLGDQGADVIHVDPPGGPTWKTDADAFLQRGKRRISLDLKSPHDRETAGRLIDSADVVIENFRPGVMDRLGVGAESAIERNARLIYCSLPGFAPDDPRADMQAWEGILDAATDNCIPRVGEEPPGWDWSRPFYSAVPLASNFGAFLGATGIVMALIARQRDFFATPARTSPNADCIRHAASTVAAPAPSAAKMASTSSSTHPAHAISSGLRRKPASPTGARRCWMWCACAMKP